MNRIHRGQATDVYRTHENDAPVIVKVLRGPYPTGEQIAAFEREIRITERVQGAGVIRLIRVDRTEPMPRMVLEDLGAHSLAVAFHGARPDQELVLRLAGHLVSSLDHIHSKQVVHKDLNPSNIVWNAQTGELKVIDFGLASETAAEESGVRERVEGTLPYISPEQTGRLVDRIGPRSDYYSLGATLYQLLSGQRPFETDDALALVHAHVAVDPAPLHEVAPHVDPRLSAIVHKLLAKSPDDRYQSAAGLRQDLEEVRSTPRATHFLPGRYDVVRELRVPSTLFGRQHDLRELTRVVRAGGTAMVSGASGTGKSALTDAVRRELATSPIRVVSGKFDRYRAGVPYAAVVDALQELVHLVLAEDETELAMFRSRLQTALGSNARVLVDVMPELELLLGRTPVVPPLPPAESENRFLGTLARFARAASTPERPLALFVDDLQWADAATLRLLSALTRAKHSPNISEESPSAAVSLVGTYRNDELGPEHPLAPWLDGIRTFTLSPLDPDDTRAMLKATVSPSQGDIDALATIAIAKTRGNPLFLRRFLRELVDRELLVHAGEHGWRFDTPQIDRLVVSDNVVRFLADKMSALEQPTSEVLQVASILGDEFDLQDVATVLEHSSDEVLNRLHAAVREEIVVPLRTTRRFRFAHDRVRQAARVLAAPDRSSQWHARIGRSLLCSFSGEGSGDLFTLVGHLNLGHEHLSAEVRLETISLNLQAGQQALDSVAYRPALRLFDRALAMSTPDMAAEQRVARLGAAEAAYLSGDRARMDVEVDRLCEAPDALMVAEALRIRMRACISAGELTQAVDVGLDALAKLGVTLKANPGKLVVASELARTRFHLRRRTPQSHVDDDELRDPLWRMALELLAELAPPAYMARPNLLPSIGFSMAATAADHGVNATASYGFALYALVLCAMGDTGLGAEYADAAEALGERFPDVRMRARRAQLIQGFVRHWTRPILSSLPVLSAGFELGVEAGDYVWAAFCAQMYTNQAFLGGRELVALRRESERYVDAIESLGQLHVLGMTEIYARATRALTGELSADDRSDRELLELIGESNDTGRALFHVVELMRAVIRRDFAGALKHAQCADTDALPATFAVPAFVLFDVITRLECANDLSGRASAVSRAEVARQRFARWARKAPSNFESKRWLIEAELARFMARQAHANACFDRAIDAATRSGNLLDLALANERAAEFQEALGNRALHRAFLREASFAYARWGAAAKVEELVSAHPEVASGEDQPREGTARTHSTSTQRLDAAAIVRASQALSEQLVLDELVCTLVRIALEVGGGTRAALFTPRGDTLHFEAAAEASAEAGVELRRLTHAFDACSSDGTSFSVPTTVLRYVQRTSNDVVLTDASAEGQFTTDSHIATHASRSLLCLPVMHKGSTRAILYLENQLLRGAFTPERLEVIRLLSAQAAISLENATLYARMEESLQAQVELTTAHSRFVPHQFLQALERQTITDVKLGDHAEKRMSILFSDIRGFTSIVENLSPAENIAFINEYLSVMEPAIIESGGFVDSYIGDAIMALFDGSPDDAVNAGVMMHAGLRGLNEKRRLQGLAPVRCGVGVNTGTLMLGTIGGETNLKCGVIGDSVNLAARVESLTKHFRIPMLISDHTLHSLDAPERWQTRLIDRVVVVGATEPVTLYEVLDAESPERREPKLAAASAYQDGIELYFDQRFAAALGRFAAVLEQCPDDLVSQKFVDRCMTYVRSGVPDDWDGIVRMESK